MSPTRLFLALNVVVFVAFGAAYLVVPAELASHVGLEVRGPTALADVRAVYGGLSLAYGVAMVRGLSRVEEERGALVLATIGSFGLMLGRLWSFAVSGLPEPIIYGFLATEIFGAVVGSALLARPADRPVRAVARV